MTNEPYSIEAERAVLGAVLIDHDAKAWPAVSHLTAGDFYRADHRAIYAAMAELDAAGEPMDPVTMDAVTVAEQLVKAGTLDDDGVLAYVAELADNTPSAAGAGAYAGIVRDKAARRRLSATLLDYARAARGPDTIEKLVAGVTRALSEIEATGAPAPSWPAVTVGDLLSEQDESLMVDVHVDDLAPIRVARGCVCRGVKPQHQPIRRRRRAYPFRRLRGRGIGAVATRAAVTAVPESNPACRVYSPFGDVAGVMSSALCPSRAVG